MYVRDCMTKNPVTLTPLDSILDAFGVMKKGNFHRLPIVENGKIVGLITASTLSDFVPSKATTLAVYEVNSILAKTRCGDIMIKDVETINQDALLEEAADKMNQHNITCLPVVDNDNNLVGIITQKVIFAGFIEVQGYYNAGTRVEVIVKEDKVGTLKDLVSLFTDAGMSISHLVVERNADNLIIVVRVSESNINKVADVLKGKYEIADIRTTA